jgi:hypothetical protein
MAKASTDKCKHPACSCQVPSGESYCSTACEDAEDMTELACQCNHATCQGEDLK